MKRICLSLFILLLAFAAMAQDEVIFEISRKKALVGSASPVRIYINGAEVTKLLNGGSYIYKALIDKTKPVIIQANAGLLKKREITINVGEGNKCVLETGFSGASIFLNLLSGGVNMPGTGAVADVKVDREDLSISYTATQTHASDTIRQQWLSKGGRIMGTSYIGGASYTRMSDDMFSMTGMGGNITITMSLLNFKVPEYEPGLKTWHSSVFGFTGSDQFFVTKTKIDAPPPVGTMTDKSFNINMMFSFNGGYTVGLGKFKNETKWKGAALELTYRPSLVISLPTNGGKGDLSLNMMGFGFDVNFNSFTSNAAKLAPKAQSKLTFFALPPIKDMPLFVSVGFGLTFYQKM
ncbi:MAG: hypothetical protein RBS37_12200 [Bacteroidales bacterium]|jgi:hypothetical protein|nr:hypothetical protein [Bacteroidales bacterium]